MRNGRGNQGGEALKRRVSLLVASIDDFTNLNREQGRGSGLVPEEIAAELRSDAGTATPWPVRPREILRPAAGSICRGRPLRVGERLGKIETLKPEGLQVTVSIGIRAPLRPGVRVFRPR